MILSDRIKVIFPYTDQQESNQDSKEIVILEFVPKMLPDGTSTLLKKLSFLSISSIIVISSIGLKLSF